MTPKERRPQDRETLSLADLASRSSLLLIAAPVLANVLDLPAHVTEVRPDLWLVLGLWWVILGLLYLHLLGFALAASMR